MAREQIAVAEMILNMIQGKTDGTSRVDYHPQKQEFPADEAYEQPFERATPESQGVSSGLLSRMIRELGNTAETDMHHLMMLRHGKVICECHFAPYRGNLWHIAHSLCKSITGMAIGLLIQEGKLSLDENIYKIFEYRNKLLPRLFRPVVTVEHLLTMTSGVQFNESGIISGNDWLSGFLNAPVSEKPGTTFQYNSMNTYVLSAIVTERTGLSLTEYLTPRLFAPMGIRKYLWETCPKGIVKGGWGLFICPEDMAKLGQLYLQKGMWKGQQLIPQEWVENSIRKHVESVEGTFGYGYQVWQESRPDSFEFNGMLGQNVIVYPDMDMVLVTCAGSNELFQNCVMLNIIRKYLPNDYHPGERLEENPNSLLLLQRLMAEMEAGEKNLPLIHKGGWEKGRNRPWGKAGNRTREVPEAIKKIAGQSYIMDIKSVGLFPLVMQVFHNNLTEGIQRIAFRCEAGEFWFRVQEGKEWHDIKVGFGKAAETWITIHEEKYLVGTRGIFTTDEDGVLVLKLDIAFLEEAVRRKAKIFFRENGIEVRWKETPGKDLIMEGLKSIMADMETNLLLQAVRGKWGTELIYLLMERTIEPVVNGKPEENCTEDERI
ncbi:serine hydrolase domain-containing protein [Novisyntrophococcus fermenticellae]|uniref:serine hydrolase domain-containing protein n=1 Tax=Novisyntrophococcus fermenticellae TaxID=2068655 RepID=UPI001E2A4565|nr:serine hydrolase [Novisyntrophococcus fermenticellae]